MMRSLAASAAPAADGRRRREALVAGAPDHERVEDGQEFLARGGERPVDAADAAFVAFRRGDDAVGGQLA